MSYLLGLPAIELGAFMSRAPRSARAVRRSVARTRRQALGKTGVQVSHDRHARRAPLAQAARHGAGRCLTLTAPRDASCAGSGRMLGDAGRRPGQRGREHRDADGAPAHGRSRGLAAASPPAGSGRAHLRAADGPLARGVGREGGDHGHDHDHVWRSQSLYVSA